MHLRINDRKVQAAIKKDAKTRKCSRARAAEMALEVYYDRKNRRRVMPL